MIYYDILLWYPVLISYYDILLWYPIMVIGILSLTNHQNAGLGRNPDQSTDPNEPQPLQPLQALRCRCNRVTLAVKMLSPMAAPAMAMFNYHGNPLVIQHSHRKLAIFLDDLSIDPNSHGTFGHIYIYMGLSRDGLYPQEWAWQISSGKWSYTINFQCITINFTKPKEDLANHKLGFVQHKTGF